MKRHVTLLLLLFACVISGCSPQTSPPNSAPPATAQPLFHIIAGSENKTLEPLLNQFATENHIDLKIDYLGSVDIMMKMQSGKLDSDAIWPSSSLWIALGDTHKHIKESQGIYWSPVVLGVKKSVAQRLGWIGKDVKVDDILKAAESGRLRFMMTSATQSNSGASAYLGFLYAFSGNPDVLTTANLAQPALRTKIKRILGTVNRSSGSSGWLKDLFLQKGDAYDGMVNYEALIIETNQALLAAGKEPLYVVYPSDGLAIADAPFGYVDNGDAAKYNMYQKMQSYLLSPAVQTEIQKLGRRVGPVGEELKAADKTVFNGDWGINTAKFLHQIRYPKAEVIQQALDLYQSSFRKPSFTVYCLDYSGSMRGQREEGLKSAMRLILDQDQARQSLLQAAPEDVTTVLTFSGKILDEWTVQGNNPDALRQLWTKVNARVPYGETDIYSPINRALDLMKQHPNLENYFPAVILMTDGESNTGASFRDVQEHIHDLKLPVEVPVFAIRFGEASEEQLKQLTDWTSGRMFDGKADLIQAFRDVKGYN